MPWRSLQRASASMRASTAPIVSQPSPSRAGAAQDDVTAAAGLIAHATDKLASSKTNVHRTDRSRRQYPTNRALGFAETYVATLNMVELPRWNRELALVGQSRTIA